MSKYLLAHDLGTSGNKATLFDTELGAVKSITAPYGVNFGSHGFAEQNPEDLWNAVIKSTIAVTEGISPSDILAVSFSAQMQGALPVDREGNVLRPSIIWADSRAVKEADLLINELGADKIYSLTGHRASPNYTIEKLMWIKANEPDVWKKTYKSLQAKDYIIFRLTGNFVTDYSDASGTNALELDNLTWSDEIFSAAGIDKEIMPELKNSIDVAGYVTKEAEKATGLLSGTPVITGGGDGPCSAIGAGCIGDNEFFSSFGTSAWIGGTTNEKFIDKNKVCFCFAHVIPGKYMPCGTMQSAGSSYSYIKELLASEMSYKDLNELLAITTPGAKGLLFLPYLLGERSPRWNEKTSGAFIGIKPAHTKADYIRAVIEGIGYNLELILKSFRENAKIDRLILTGGGAMGESVCQILSDILYSKLVTPEDARSATSVAAALIAGVGAGVYPDFSAYKKFLTFNKEYTPESKNAPVYEKYKKIFDDSYYALMPIFDELYTI